MFLIWPNGHYSCCNIQVLWLCHYCCFICTSQNTSYFCYFSYWSTHHMISNNLSLEFHQLWHNSVATVQNASWWQKMLITHRHVSVGICSTLLTVSFMNFAATDIQNSGTHFFVVFPPPYRWIERSLLLCMSNCIYFY